MMAAGALLLLCGCGGSASRNTDAVSEHKAVVSIEPLRLLVADVAGDRWSVDALAGAGANPETFDPTITTMRSAAAAEVVFTTGALGFESQIVEKMTGRHQRVVDFSEAIDPITGTHQAHHHHDDEEEDDHHHGVTDPHIWNSLRNASAISQAAARALAAADPDNGDYYRHRADSLSALYLRADSILASQLAVGTVFLTGHPSLSYFARDYSLQQITVGADNKELSVDAMRRALAGARQNRAATYFAESSADSSRMSTLARQAGVNIVVINPLDPDIRATISRAAAALS